MAEIQVLIDGDHVPAVRDLFIEAGATGHPGASTAGRPPVAVPADPLGRGQNRLVAIGPASV